MKYYLLLSSLLQGQTGERGKDRNHQEAGPRPGRGDETPDGGSVGDNEDHVTEEYEGSGEMVKITIQ